MAIRWDKVNRFRHIGKHIFGIGLDNCFRSELDIWENVILNNGEEIKKDFFDKYRSKLNDVYRKSWIDKMSIASADRHDLTLQYTAISEEIYKLGYGSYIKKIDGDFIYHAYNDKTTYTDVREDSKTYGITVGAKENRNSFPNDVYIATCFYKQKINYQMVIPCASIIMKSGSPFDEHFYLQPGMGDSSVYITNDIEILYHILEAYRVNGERKKNDLNGVERVKLFLNSYMAYSIRNQKDHEDGLVEEIYRATMAALNEKRDYIPSKEIMDWARNETEYFKDIINGDDDRGEYLCFESLTYLALIISYYYLRQESIRYIMERDMRKDPISYMMYHLLDSLNMN